MADLVERGRDAYTRWNNPPSTGLPDDAGVVLEMAERIETLERALITVQNAAKTLASARGTELEHLRQNHAFDHKIRAEHESLIERDSMMTDALLKAEARIAALEAEAFKGERRGMERAAKVAERTEERLTELGPAGATYSGYASTAVYPCEGKAIAAAIRALIPEAPVREADSKDDPRYPALLADALARGRNENLDGSPRRHASTTPPQDNREAE